MPRLSRAWAAARADSAVLAGSAARKDFDFSDIFNQMFGGGAGGRQLGLQRRGLAGRHRNFSLESRQRREKTHQYSDLRRM